MVTYEIVEQNEEIKAVKIVFAADPDIWFIFTEIEISHRNIMSCPTKYKHGPNTTQLQFGRSPIPFRNPPTTRNVRSGFPPLDFRS